MAPSKQKQRLGTYISSSVGGETVRAFIPPPLPPVPDPLLNTLHRTSAFLTTPGKTIAISFPFLPSLYFRLSSSAAVGTGLTPEQET
jgi:hypothetical protein